MAEGMSDAGRLLVIVGFLVHAAVGLLILVSGLIMPLWAVWSLAAVWAAILAAMIARRRSSRFVLAAPLVMAAIWLATAWAGGAFLDWTA